MDKENNNIPNENKLANPLDYDTIGFSPQYHKFRVAEFKSMSVTPNRTIFLGNSLTQRGDWAQLFNDSTIINHGVNGDLTFGVIRRLKETLRQQPNKVFMMIGINDLAKGVPDSVIVQNINHIVKEFNLKSPSTKVFLQSILPVNDKLAGFPEGFSFNKNIVEINSFMENNSLKLHYRYIDLHSKFIDGNGLLDEKYTSDGLHLSQLGYEHWAKQLQEFLND